MNTKLTMAARLLLGLILVVFGLNGFLNFMPIPAPTPEAGALLGSLAKTGYFFPFVKAIEVIAGVLLLSDKFTAFALILFTPILVGIAQINFILNPGGIAITLVMLVLHIFLAYQYREKYKPIFS
jgi:putative oxidoreductase